MKTQFARRKGMGRVLAAISRFAANQSGAAAIEYVIIAATLTLALVPGFYYVSGAMDSKFQFIIDFITG
jgi:Flp pilus assembly pilin Flp